MHSPLFCSRAGGHVYMTLFVCAFEAGDDSSHDVTRNFHIGWIDNMSLYTLYQVHGTLSYRTRPSGV